MRLNVRMIALVMCTGLVLAACAKKSSPAAAGSPAGSSPMVATAMLRATSVSSLGKVLAAGNGRTLYVLTADKGGATICAASAACAGVWPPFFLPAGTSSPQGASGLTSSLLGTKVSTGHTQVTYNGWPLYTYTGDSGPAQSNGEGIKSFGGTWYAVGTSGTPMKSGASPSAGGGW